MAPKTVKAKEEKATKAVVKGEMKEKDKKTLDKDKTVSKLDMAGFITAAKKTSNAALRQAYDEHVNLPRFDSRKAAIVARWKVDKSCRWVTDYIQTMGQSTEKSTVTMQGYGTRLGIVLCT